MKYKTVLSGFFVFFIAFGCTFGKGKISVEIVYPEKTLVNPSLTVTAQTAGGSPEEITSETGERIEISSLEAGNYNQSQRRGNCRLGKENFLSCRRCDYDKNSL